MRKTSKAKNNMESVAESFYSFFHVLLSGLLLVYMFLILAVMPFYFTNGYASIGTDKANFFRQISIKIGILLVPVFVIFGVFYIIVTIQKKRAGGLKNRKLWDVVRSQFSVTDAFVLLFMVTLLLSYALSDYKKQALWGAQGWYIGLLPQLFVCLLYFWVSRFWNPGKWMVYLILPVSAVVFALGYLNRFEIRPLEMTAHNPGFISTIGNINWYCGYLVTVFFGGVLLLWQGEWKNMWQKFLLSLYVGIGYASLLTQGSVSGLFAMVVMFLVMFCLSASDGRRMQSFCGVVFIFSLACLVTRIIRHMYPDKISFHDSFMDLFTDSSFAVVVTAVSFLAWRVISYFVIMNKYPVKVFVITARIVAGVALGALAGYIILVVMNTRNPGAFAFLEGKPQFIFNEKFASNRGATWMAGIKCFGEQDLLHKLFGVGPDGMSAYLYKDGSEELRALVKESFGVATLTNTHNEWLTILVNEGLLGVIGYVGMMMTAIVRYIKAKKTNLIAAFGGFCLLAFTVNNIFSFQQSMNLATVFVIFGVSEAFMRRKCR